MQKWKGGVEKMLTIFLAASESKRTYLLYKEEIPNKNWGIFVQAYTF